MADESAPPNSGIFISYRGMDVGETASALARDLGRLFGSGRVFIDHLRLRPAESFPDELIIAVTNAAVVLVLIGKSWLSHHNEHGIRLIDLPDDWVRREVEAALETAVAVLPVYVEGAQPLVTAAFATVPSLARLADLQGTPLRRRCWEPDLARLRERLIELGVAEVEPAALARSAIEVLGRVDAAVWSQPAQVRRAAQEKLLADLEQVHRDYLFMFTAILDETPEAWQEGSPDYIERVRGVAGRLRRLRLQYEPVRVRIKALAEALSRTSLPAPEQAFIAAVLAYFPTGAFRAEAGQEPRITSGTAVLDRFYRHLDGEAGPDLGEFVRVTIEFHRKRWQDVCEAYAGMQVAGSGAR